MAKIKFSQLLDTELKKRGISKTWLSESLPMNYDTLLYKFRNNSFSELEQNYIKSKLNIKDD